MKFISFLISSSLICSLFLFPFQTTAKKGASFLQETKPLQPPDSLYAYSAVLYDAEFGRVLYEKNGHEKLPIASTTKIMSLLVILESGKLSETLTVSKNAAMQPDVQLNINTGEQYLVRDLCYSLMLESHNDSAVALAEHVCGSVEAFAEKMNEIAKKLGAFSAKFVTPNGLDMDDNGCNAEDLAKIASYAIRNEEFITITNTQTYSFSEKTKGRTFTVNNKNRFLTMMDGAIGIKTGFTGKAGYCFVGALKQEEHTLVSVVLASGWPPNKSYKWTDTRKLMEYGLSGFQKLPLVTEENAPPELPELPVTDGIHPFVELVYDSKEYRELKQMKLLRSKEDTVSYEICFTVESLKAPVLSGSQVGTLLVFLSGKEIKKIPIQTSGEVASASLSFYLKKAFDFFFSPEKLIPLP